MSVCGPKGSYEYFALSASDILGNPENPYFQAPAVVIPAITRVSVSTDKTTGVVTTIVASAQGGVPGVTNLPIANVTTTTPLQVTTSAPHRLSSGDPATIDGVQGATLANGTWRVTKVDDTNFTLNGSVGGLAYTGGGTVDGGILGEVDRVIQARAVPDTDTAMVMSASSFAIAIVAIVNVPVANVQQYRANAATALAAYVAALPLGGIDGALPYNDVLGVIYAAGILTPNQPSVVSQLTLVMNGANTDAVYPSAAHVAILDPIPTIQVVPV